MSFSSEIKTDLSKIRLKTDAMKLSQLAGLTKACGSLCIARSGRSLIYKTESIAVGKLISSLAAGYPVETTIELQSLAHRRNPLYIVTLTGNGVDALLKDTGVLPKIDGERMFEGSLPQRLVKTEDLKRALLRGAFLGSGSANDPKRGYHLEIVTRSDSFSDTLIRILQEFHLDARKSIRKERDIVYLKGEDVSGFLAFIGANSGALAFENARTEKDFRNYLNRTSNCETANIGKTVEASVMQRSAIERIEDQIGLRKLPEPLYEAAMLRLAHPDATLSELADLAEIGKSGMNHRLTRLMRIAEELEEP